MIIQKRVFLSSLLHCFFFYRNRRASRSDSMSAKMSPSRTGPLTLRIIRRFWSSKNLTRTWVTCNMGITTQHQYCTIWPMLVQRYNSFGRRLNILFNNRCWCNVWFAAIGIRISFSLQSYNCIDWSICSHLSTTASAADDLHHNCELDGSVLQGYN